MTKNRTMNASIGAHGTARPVTLLGIAQGIGYCDNIVIGGIINSIK